MYLNDYTILFMTIYKVSCFWVGDTSSDPMVYVIQFWTYMFLSIDQKNVNKNSRFPLYYLKTSCIRVFINFNLFLTIVSYKNSYLGRYLSLIPRNMLVTKTDFRITEEQNTLK